MSVNMANNNLNEDLCRRREAQEQTSRTQQEALENIEQMLTQFLFNQNINDTGSDHNEEEYNNDEHPKTESKESSLIDVEVIKGIQAQIAREMS